MQGILQMQLAKKALTKNYKKSNLELPIVDKSSLTFETLQPSYQVDQFPSRPVSKTTSEPTTFQTTLFHFVSSYQLFMLLRRPLLFCKNFFTNPPFLPFFSSPTKLFGSYDCNSFSSFLFFFVYYLTSFPSNP